MSELYRLIHTEKANYPILLLCRVLHVARSSYYAWREGEAARRARQAADDALAHEITVLHIASRKTYGVPRVHAELRRLGRRVNRKRVARVMRERDIRGVTRRKHRSLTRPDAKAKPAPDLIGRDFHAEHPGTKLVGDITYLPTAEGWLYLACWLDLATRVVGYAMADHHRAELVVDALDMAHGRTRLEPGCVIHSDRGSEGGFNWSSQHLDHGGMRWDETGSRRCQRRLRERDGSGRRIGRCDRRCVHRVGRSRLVRCSATSGGGSRRE
ncbi:IS3 family transposase [Streptomyces sp. B21-105]|uniref:IS3 family transposase n=1 Tax=Streptomyces sp. B21-105 TaxID=3039417 RepID=UPI002FF24A49